MPAAGSAPAGRRAAWRPRWGSGRCCTTPAARRSPARRGATPSGRSWSPPTPGDIVAREALHRVGSWLGLGVANLVNIFNPGMIVFGGTLRDIYLGAAAPIRSVLTNGALAAPREKVKLRTAALRDDTTLVGAAEFAFAEVLADPVQVLTRLRAPEDTPV
ncbi:ROK family protein [Actinomadura madurae]|uniref:ROK family protein n=1 Tax=Actinomadura madurae TaxID=1993 RepID=UPI0027E26EFE|nr:ROK family protein [Actinomadura madurae]